MDEPIKRKGLKLWDYLVWLQIHWANNATMRMIPKLVDLEFEMNPKFNPGDDANGDSSQVTAYVRKRVKPINYLFVFLIAIVLIALVVFGIKHLLLIFKTKRK